MAARSSRIERSGNMSNKTILLALMSSSLLAALAIAPAPARAHCDTLDGPVVKAARGALEKGDLAPVLWWVKPAHEAEVKAAFQRARAVRGTSPEARELADTWFFETVVRLHRAGEGAPFDGLKPAGASLPHAVVAADRALEGTVSVDTLVKHVSGAVERGIRSRFAETLQRRKLAPTSVEAGREFVESYVSYVHYVEGLAAMAEGHGAHGEAHEAAAGTHEH
jgi:hypothetical protein